MNAIALGFIGTDVLKFVPADDMEKTLAQIPMHRIGRSEEIVSAVTYLVFSEAGDITGRIPHLLDKLDTSCPL